MATKKDKLAHYKKRRDFAKTPEPTGGKKLGKAKHIFVIQKHASSRLHYDFRLEIDGVMKSWAIPKGPSTNPKDKRLAVETEDHPMDYAQFEGIIPEGEYGAGTVMIWDYGTYRNMKEVDGMSMKQCYLKGRIEVWLEGKKLQGGYALIHTHMGDSDKNWLFFKLDDEHADARRNPVSTQQKSARTGRTMTQIKKETSE